MLDIYAGVLIYLIKTGSGQTLLLTDSLCERHSFTYKSVLHRQICMNTHTGSPPSLLPSNGSGGERGKVDGMEFWGGFPGK